MSDYPLADHHHQRLLKIYESYPRQSRGLHTQKSRHGWQCVPMRGAWERLARLEANRGHYSWETAVSRPVGAGRSQGSLVRPWQSRFKCHRLKKGRGISQWFLRIAAASWGHQETCTIKSHSLQGSAEPTRTCAPKASKVCLNLPRWQQSFGVKEIWNKQLETVSFLQIFSEYQLDATYTF